LFDQRDMLHIRGLGDDGIHGFSVVQKARESIGLGIATERFGAAFFGNGATFGGIIKFPVGAASNTQARESFKQSIERRHQGVDNSHRLLALYDGGDYQQIGIPPEDAQFLQTRIFQTQEIARWFNLPPTS
jgi:HK97 family phage portal protein